MRAAHLSAYGIRARPPLTWGHAYADGGDRGLLWARSKRWDRNNRCHLTGGCCVQTAVTWRAGIAVGLESSVACPETLHPRRQQGSARSERGRFGAELPPWQIDGSFATSCCSMKRAAKRAACRPVTRACMAMKHATSPVRACLPDNVRSAAIRENTAKPPDRQQGGGVSNQRTQDCETNRPARKMNFPGACRPFLLTVH